MKNETIIQLLRDKIRDEENLLQDYHKGRVEAFRYVLELLEDDYEDLHEKYQQGGAPFERR